MINLRFGAQWKLLVFFRKKRIGWARRKLSGTAQGDMDHRERRIATASEAADVDKRFERIGSAEVNRFG